MKKISPDSDSEVREWLRKHSLRVTDGRVLVVEALRAQPTPISLKDLHAQLSSLDFATIFRFVRVLEGKNLLVSHIWNDNSIRYALHNEEAHECHHHYLICRVCKRAEELDECTVNRMEKHLRDRMGYVDLTHSLQFFGLCPQCQTPKKKVLSAHSSKCRH